MKQWFACIQTFVGNIIFTATTQRKREIHEISGEHKDRRHLGKDTAALAAIEIISVLAAWEK